MTNNLMATVLVVDDTPENIDVLCAILSKDYMVKIATNGSLALIIANASPPDLVLLDVAMPGMDGYEVCTRLKENEATRRIPVIFVTARDDIDAETRGLAAGANDYLTRPINARIVSARVKTHLALYDQRRHLEIMVGERTAELEESNRILEETRLGILTRLCRAAEYRDNDTGLHITRVSLLSKMLAGAAGHSDVGVEMLRHASMMHDVGKIGIPDSILLKKGTLTQEEFNVIKTHTVIGSEIIGEHDALLLIMAREVAMTHHEKWDGTGYPLGLKEKGIPVTGRIVAIVDVFDALISRRPYKPPWSMDKSLERICNGAGNHFEPELVQFFLERVDDVQHIMNRYGEPEEVTIN